MNIVLMAGGGGTRLWPLSRKHHPKQFLKLDGQKTLLEMAYDRARRVTTPDTIYISSNHAYAEKIKQLLPDIPAERIFLEPERRETGPAFAAVALQLAALGQGNEPTVFMWADHVFTAEEDYITDLKKIPQLLTSHPESLVIVGHTPTFAETGFGYIEAGQPVSGFDDVFAVKSFKEKPDAATAEQYIAAGNYFWNMGSISATPNYFIAQLQRFEPDLMAAITKSIANHQAGDEVAAAKAYSEAKKIAIDYALLERTSPIFVVTGNYGWSDVGNWAAVRDVFGINGDHDPHGHHIHVDSHNNYIYNATNKAVSMIGMTNTIVVVTDDAILVTDKSKAHKVKDVVAKLEEQAKEKFL